MRAPRTTRRRHDDEEQEEEEEESLCVSLSMMRDMA